MTMSRIAGLCAAVIGVLLVVLAFHFAHSPWHQVAPWQRASDSLISHLGNHPMVVFLAGMVGLLGGTVLATLAPQD